MVDKLLSIPRFRSQYDSKRGGFVEVSEEEMDMDYHYRIVDDELDVTQISDEYVGDIYGKMQFDFNKPWWQVLYFPRLKDGRSLVLTRISHAIGDGISQVELLFKLMDAPDDSSAEGAKLALKPPVRHDFLQYYSVRAVLIRLLAKGKRKVVKSSYGPLNKARIFVSGIFSPFYGTYKARCLA